MGVTCCALVTPVPLRNAIDRSVGWLIALVRPIGRTALDPTGVDGADEPMAIERVPARLVGVRPRRVRSPRSRPVRRFPTNSRRGLNTPWEAPRPIGGTLHHQEPTLVVENGRPAADVRGDVSDTVRKPGSNLPRWQVPQRAVAFGDEPRGRSCRCTTYGSSAYSSPFCAMIRTSSRKDRIEFPIPRPVRPEKEFTVTIEAVLRVQQQFP